MEARRQGPAAGRVAAVGEPRRLLWPALGGALVFPAEGPGAVRDAWRSLPADVAVVLLTPAAAAVLGPALDEDPRPVAVMPP